MDAKRVAREAVFRLSTTYVHDEGEDTTMQELLFISRMTLGDERKVLDVHGGFPQAALEGEPGVERVRAFLGSGFYALEITVGDGNVQENLHRFLENPEVERFFAELGAHVDTLPRADRGTADMPLAAPLLDWRRGVLGTSD